MFSNIIFRSAAAFGGAPFRLVKSTALGSAGAGIVTGSLVGGLFGKSNTNKTNEMNYKIMQEQNRFNAEEAEKTRKWQEMMYQMYGTSSAKANDIPIS